MTSYNVVWILVDSVRRYHTDADDRGRLAIMDEFAQHAVQLANCVTSAPSTMMSISAMMTSLPSYYLGRNYSDYCFDRDYFVSLPTVLKDRGYHNRAILMHPETRRKLQLFDPLDDQYRPKELSYARWWNNSEILKTVRHIIATDGAVQKMPSFWFIDFNCRKDPGTSDIVAETMSALHEAGYTPDNTIMILCSDHGYPDPSRGVNAEYLQKHRLTHDIFMTDDNIMIPMLIRYPGCPAGTTIQETVSSLDIMPTLLDLLDVDIDPAVRERFQGRSLVSLMQGRPSADTSGRFIRTDARFQAQRGRLTAVRSARFKYVTSPDDGVNAFFDLDADPMEVTDIIDSDDEAIQAEIARFKHAFTQSEEAAVAAQIDYTVHKLQPHLSRLRLGESRPGELSVLLVSTVERGWLASVARALGRIIGPARYDVIGCGQDADLSGPPFDAAVTVPVGARAATESLAVLRQRAYDLIVVVHEPQRDEAFETLKQSLKGIRAANRITMDLNMQVTAKTGQIARYLRRLYSDRQRFAQEPTLVLAEMRNVAGKLAMQIGRKFLPR